MAPSLASLDPRAAPTAQENPWPRLPVVMSMPVVRSMSQWLGRLVPPWFNVSSSALSK